MATVHVSVDRLEAYVQLGAPAELAAVRGELDALGVTHGLDEAALAAACAQGTGDEPARVARGQAPVAPLPPRFELEVDLDARVGAVEEGSERIDFRERGGMCSVSAGESLGVLLPAEEGREGLGVDGEPIPAPCSEEQAASVGTGVRCVEGPDGRCILHAELDGVVRISADGQLNVSDALEIPGDVDLETGNLDVKGSLVIRGAIRAGFHVRAGKDILVAGVIEDAHVEAGGALQVGGGIIGGGEAVIQAGEGIHARFSQNAILRCDGDVRLGSDTHSQVECRGELVAGGEPGCLRGGTYWAASGLQARELGSEHGVATSVQVGEDPHLARQAARARASLDSVLARIRNLQRKIQEEDAQRVGQTLTPEIAQDIRRSMKALSEERKQEELMARQLAEIEAQLVGVDDPTIRVESLMHAGVELRIGGVSLSVKSQRPGGTFRLDQETREISSERSRRT